MVMALSRIQLALCFSHEARSGSVVGISIAMGFVAISKRIVFAAAESVNSKCFYAAEIVQAVHFAALSNRASASCTRTLRQDHRPVRKHALLRMPGQKFSLAAELTRRRS